MCAGKHLRRLGQSGKPKGRPPIKGAVNTLRAQAIEALEASTDLMRSGSPDAVRLTAANARLDRDWGRPRQAVDEALTDTP